MSWPVPLICLLVFLLILTGLDGKSEQHELYRQRRNINYQQQPRMTSERGNLVFITGSAQSIEFRTGIQGKVKINEEDLGECLNQIQKNKNDITELKRSGSDLPHNVSYQITHLSNQLMDLQRRFQSLQQTVQRKVCSSNPCQNGGTCLNLLDSFFCLCPHNWKGPVCSADVNECEIYAGTPLSCQNGGTCFNTAGSYSCTCRPENYGPQCASAHNDCHQGSKALCGNGICEDLDREQMEVPKYRCLCDAGWKAEPHGVACVDDIDECSLPDPPCSQDPLVECINTQGSFYCGACPIGWKGNGYRCQDIDECETDNGGCSVVPMVQCINTAGSYHCGSCPPGYQGNGKVCTEINVCLENNGDCHPNAVCTPGPGVIPTCTCQPGYTGHGYGPNGCVPLSHICLTSPCVNGECIETVSGYHCKCNPGWEGINCTENINECLSTPCFNGGTCTDGINGYTCECTSSWTGSQCQTPQQACGGLLSGLRGSFSYPNLQFFEYNSNVNCFWIVRTEERKVLRVTFPYFQLDSRDSCHNQFLQIHDGDSSGAHPLGKYCGSSHPSELISSNNALYFYFHSNLPVNEKVFTVRWETQQPECGGLLTGTYGSINSPGYPGNYPPNRDCIWIITTSPGLVLTFAFGTLSLEHHTNSSEDYLEIRDGPLSHDPVLRKFYSTLSVPPLETTGPFAWIHFHSDSVGSDRGFHITYVTSLVDSECGGNYTDAEGTLISPDWPNSYIHNRQCLYIITQPPGERIHLNFTHVELDGWSHCSQSSIEVRDDETLLEKLCDSKIPVSVYSISNSIWIRFKSALSVQKASFLAFYQVACGGELTGEGTIRTPFYPNVYPHEKTCYWKITQPQGQVIILNFTDFWIDSSANCDTDYLEIGNSLSMDPSQTTKYCGLDVPGLVPSIYNIVYIRFRKSASSTNYGFLAQYSATNLACGEILTAPSGSFTSPGHPNIYPHGVNCTWLISVQTGYRIRLSFLKFHLDFHYNCTSDYLEVFDSGTKTTLGRYCGKSVPPSIMSSSNILMLRLVTDADIAYEGFSVTYTSIDASKACLEDYTSQFGFLYSPNFPSNYPNNAECIYTISVERGHQIALNFANFSLEDPIGLVCIADYVEVKDGGHENSLSLGKHCGTDKPPMIISHSNKLWIKFKSDSFETHSGFFAYWDASLTGCGGNLTTPVGTFMSPNYPMPYYHNSECFWLLKSSRGSQFELTFQKFHLESHPNCSSDYLAVYDGLTEDANLLAKLCGNEIPPLIRSSGDSMFIKLRTDEKQEGGGFLAEYAQTCQDVVIANLSHGVLESINYPNPYFKAQNCNWTIEVTAGNTINYTFLAFELEDDENCTVDYLELYDGPQLIGRYCGAELPPPGSTTGSKLHVIFCTDWLGHNEMGFQMSWNLNGCGGELTGPSGFFTSPQYPEKYPPNKECIWYIHTAPGSSIQLTIEDFDVEHHSNCRFDVLEVYGGPDFDSPRVAQLCSSRSRENPLQVSSAGNSIAVRFKTDSSINGRGFNASWLEIPDGCGGIFQASSGEIHSPNYPRSYRSNTDCSWLIQVDRNHHILLNFTDVDFELQDACITVHDGLSATSALLANLCGRQQPFPIISSRNILLVRFQSRGTSQSRGFRARFTEACGSFILTDSIGSISSPLFPAKYQNNQNCSWIIEAQPPFNHITLSFIHFELEPSPNCSRDYIEILDGNDYDAPLQGRYCGRNMPLPITSFGNSLIVRFISNQYVGYKGFHATYTASSSACGGTFNMIEGVFNSPGYPDIYPPNVECVWNIPSSPGNQLQLSFITFQLEESEGCTKDYLEIREGNATGHLFGRYCGHSLSVEYKSIAGHVLWIKFASDGSGSGTGFQATFVHTFGNDDIVGTHGKIASPLWPRNYPHNSDYHWTVNVNASQIIHGTILEMDIERTMGCFFDKLMIHDGPSIHSRLLGTYCGTDTSSFTSFQNSITFHFFSDSSISGKGFLLEWNAVESPSEPVPTIATGACGGYLRTGEVPGFFFSPGWPENYNNRADCSWIIQAPDSTVELNILSMDIESYQSCSYDKLVIRDGDNHVAPELAVLCGREVPGPIRSSGEYLFIHFTSDSSVTGAGFNASFHKSCGGYLHASRGVITSPNYPEAYPPNLNCSWHVLVPSGLTIAVHFEHPFEIHNVDSSCIHGDYLMMKNGPDSSSPALGIREGNGRFCGSHAFSTLYTTDNEMFVQFVSDNSYEGQGFKIQYEAQSLACGGNIYLSESNIDGYVTSPNYPDNYPLHVDCVWTISVPTGKLIKLQFEDQFNIKISPNCTSSYLEVRDGGDSNAPVLSKFCGSSLPGSQLSSGDMVYLRFRSDDSSTNVGFKVKYSLAVCGGTLGGLNGVIESPQYPVHPYPENLLCEWYLQVPSGHYLTLHFENLDLQNSSNCEKDFVEIREEDASGNVLGRFCGNTIPETIDTRSNLAFVKFVTDGSISAPGFKLVFEASLEGCGGYLNGPSGIFTSPRYPNANFHSRECEWSITVPEGRRVTLTFTNLRLEDHSSCDTESVTVFNGILNNSPQLERICGPVSARDFIESSGNTMKVLFVTDGSRPYGGFSAFYSSSEDAVCGGELTDPHGGNFTSPGYDGFSNYAKNLNCEWTITNPNSHNSSIYISFEDFHLEQHQDCHSDALEFRIEHAGGPQIIKICGQSLPTVPFAIPFPQIWVHFVTNQLVEKTGFQAHYSFTDCGGIQTGEGGVITSPNYPSPYGKLSHCAWLLKAPQGHTITLSFTSFDIENHIICLWDSVTVLNGGTLASPVIGHFCGMTIPKPIQSGSNQLLVIFNSDHSVQRGGFSATWTTQTLGCGGILHFDSGIIKSPHWPQNFPVNSRCTWTVIVHESRHLEISFDNNFLIPSSDGQCQDSYIKVWAGTEATEAALLATACGSVPPSRLILPRNSFTAVFQSQNATGPGFSASYRSSCGANFTSPSGYIVSPNYPRQYDNSMNCIYIIKAGERDIVLLDFQSFHLQEPSSISGMCTNDGVKIIRGYEADSIHSAVFCGNEIPRSMSIIGPMILNFYSDNSETDFGFKATYTILPCGGVFNSSIGIIKSPAYSRANYANDLECSYLITVTNDKVIALKFNDFDVAISPSCSADYLAVYDGPNINAPLLGTFCGSVLPPNIKSTNNSLFLVFKTDFSETAKGWTLSYRETLGPQNGCGGFLTNSNSTFTSPDSNADGIYDKNLNCVWTIIAPINKIINLTFTTFSLESSSFYRGCIYDYVKIYDGYNENANLVGTFCGSIPPAPFISKGNFLTVKFVSDVSVEKRGFNATYTTLDLPCGGTFNATQTPQTTGSPQSPNLFFPLFACTWIIDAPPQQRVKLVVQTFQLHSEDCSENYLQIQDSPENGESSVHQFCSKNATAVPKFYSSGRTVVVVFKSEEFRSDSRVMFTYQISDCNREYNQTFGSLRSPGWPENYGNNLDCSTIVRAPENYKITLFFNSFNVEYTSECRDDFLEVRNGSDGSSPLLGKYCGPLLPNPIFSKSHLLYLRFKSDIMHSGHGYEILWTSSPSACGGPLYGDSGSLTSPGYPDTYENNTHCEWTVTGSAGKILVLSFSFFSIYDPGECIQNYLILYDGPDSNSPSTGPFCGTGTNAVSYLTTTHQVFIKFHAEYAASPSAFRLTWRSSDDYWDY
ncbi:cubilin [Sarcophilus harrisii]|uniref:cubilin n=1 Tax=Sarcophilus harrisii TaxID=9305 RepID=UPI0013020773|nr:cubilin [Sarcophilus harrisii]